MKVYCDNKIAISIDHNLVLRDRTKHIEVDKQFIKKKISRWMIHMPYVSTSERVVDILIKGLHKK
jgi:hypothetical protein